MYIELKKLGLSLLMIFFSTVCHSVSDFNFDGKDDILWRNNITAENAIYFMNGASISSVEPIITGGVPPLEDPDLRIVATGDFSGFDDIDDILFRHRTTGELSLWHINSTIITANSPVFQASDLNWEVVGTGDFDNDSRDDVLWFNNVTKQTHIFLILGFTLKSDRSIFTAPANWKPVSVGDFDNDGKSDVLWRNSVTGENWIWLMDGLDIASQGPLMTVADINWEVAGVGDFDADSKSDLLWRNSVTGETYIFLMDGFGIKSQGSLITVTDLSWEMQHVGDFNGDGKSDTFWRNSVTGQNWMLLLDGIGIDLSQEVSNVPDLNWKVNGD